MQFADFVPKMFLLEIGKGGKGKGKETRLAIYATQTAHLGCRGTYSTCTVY